MLDRLINRGGQIAAWLFFVAILISVYEVVMRYVLNAPSTWVHVLSTALCALCFCLGGAFCMVRREHIRITLLWDFASRGQRRWIDILSCIVGVIYLAGMGWGAWLQARESVLRFDSGQWTPELTPGPPNWPLPALVKTALLVGAVLFLLVVLRDLTRHLRRREG